MEGQRADDGAKISWPPKKIMRHFGLLGNCKGWQAPCMPERNVNAGEGR
jgi:hypothetical protein